MCIRIPTTLTKHLGIRRPLPRQLCLLLLGQPRHFSLNHLVPRRRLQRRFEILLGGTRLAQRTARDTTSVQRFRLVGGFEFKEASGRAVEDSVAALDHGLCVGFTAEFERGEGGVAQERIPADTWYERVVGDCGGGSTYNDSKVFLTSSG